MVPLTLFAILSVASADTGAFLWLDTSDPAAVLSRGFPTNTEVPRLDSDTLERPGGPIRRVTWQRAPDFYEIGQDGLAVLECDPMGRTTLIEEWSRQRLRYRKTIEHLPGSVTIRVSSSPDEEAEKWVWTLDDAGLPLRRERHYVEGPVLVDVRLDYDDERRILSRTHFDTDGYPTEILTVRRDPRGRVERLTHALPGREPRTLLRYAYDVRSHVTEVVDGEGQRLWHGEYDRQGRLRATWRAGKSSHIATELMYDEHGALIERETLRFAASSGGFQSRSVQMLAAPDRPIRSMYIDVAGYIRSEISYDYELDARGNWIVRSVTANHPSLARPEARDTRAELCRTIEYHE